MSAPPHSWFFQFSPELGSLFQQNLFQRFHVNVIIRHSQLKQIDAVSFRDVGRNFKGEAVEPINGGSRNLFWGSNQVLQSKVEGEARIEREAPDNWGWSRNRGRSPRKNGGRGLGRELDEPLPRNFLKSRTWIYLFWCIFEANIWNKWQHAMVRDHVQLPTFMQKSKLNIWCLEIV